VDRGALDKVLNESVGGKEVLDRVNAQVGQEVHDGGTAKVDRDSVRQFLEAARTGEFSAIDNAPGEGTQQQPDRQTAPTPDAFAADAEPSRELMDTPRPVPPPTQGPPPMPANDEGIMPATPGRSATMEDSVQEFTQGQLNELSSSADDAAATGAGGGRAVIWVFVLAIGGALLGIVLAAAWLALGS
jgi:hypothetical protein